MPICLNPRLALQIHEGDKPMFLNSRNYEEVAKNNEIYKGGKLLLLPCGKCPNCMENKALEWTSRLVKESEEWKYTYFVTLTYDDKNVKDLNKRDIQLFLKRLRKDTGYELKYYVSGEYGEVTNRPHYHAIFFLNDKITDLVFYKDNLFTSKTVFSAWQMGQVLISNDVNERSIKYTIGYTLKKKGESKVQLMSKGLGFKYLLHKKEAIKFSNGFYLNNGFFVNPPSYFIRKMKESNNSNDLKWLDDYENQPRSSKKLDKSLDDLFDLLLEKSSIKKGKGDF